MPGIGSIIVSATNICSSTIIDSASGIASIDVLSNTQQIVKLSIVVNGANTSIKQFGLDETGTSK
jgi:hypothetical protein